MGPHRAIFSTLLMLAAWLCCGIAPAPFSFAPVSQCEAAVFGRGPKCRVLTRRRGCPDSTAKCRQGPASNSAPQANKEPTEIEPAWRPLFDGRTLAGWKSTRFGGEGEVRVDDGQIILDFGYSLTGITYTGEFPKTNYEISLQAKRTAGIDFFCGLTFPVEESYCSFIVAGWAGAVVGLSSIDGRDASENETTRYMSFDNDRWYHIRVRVTPARIRAWIDEELVVDQKIVGRRISTRNEVDLSRPLGISAYESTAALREIKYRLLPEAE